ncbi:esterase-like activity of phytase family protein [Ancylobacter sp. 6x-1]|uniref:Esterase-like activity of phytase family protein n=1 Tax=Ancylobacter crimeensis TaxID=2579147 RepID=A0ABT0D6F0_9HYPH|nr:esterase-like activity of phytase family protein [Ancylobacter crimeensis]MCK0195514.1 esterase-like activity of phytase family protein [Ancylobacter crimeensis]
MIRLPSRSLRALLGSVALSALALAAAPVRADDAAFPATLAGHAVMPAESFIDMPADAPEDLKTSGKYTTGVRVDKIGSVEGTSAGRPTGVFLPFKGQPLQGDSGIKKMPDGSFLILTDNGMGAKANSPDSALYLNRYTIDWKAGTFERLETIFLRDPDHKVPFRIVHEDTGPRYLTGADFDPESFQPIGEHIYIGEEFGPYLIKADRSGTVVQVFESRLGDTKLRSPDHYAVTSAGTPDAPPAAFNIRRSKGFEGMAASPDGRFLYPLLEGPVWNPQTTSYEKDEDGRDVLQILEFDTTKDAWTGRHWLYPLGQNGNAIGDFNMIDASTGLIIERDNGEGTSDKVCAEGKKAADCFHDLAKYKRIVKIEMTDANQGGAVRKIGHIDLMAIEDPNHLSRKPLTNGKLAFPFFTIEDVDVVDATHIVVGNDNNLPFSSSRDPKKADDNELILLEVGDFLKAK